MKQTITNRTIEKQQYWDNSRSSTFSAPLRKRCRGRQKQERESLSQTVSAEPLPEHLRNFTEDTGCRRRGSSPTPSRLLLLRKGGVFPYGPHSVLTLRRALRRHTELWKLTVTDKSHTHTLGMDCKVLALVALLTVAIWSPETDGKWVTANIYTFTTFLFSEDALKCWAAT